MPRLSSLHLIRAEGHKSFLKTAVAQLWQHLHCAPLKQPVHVHPHSHCHLAPHLGDKAPPLPSLSSDPHPPTSNQPAPHLSQRLLLPHRLLPLSRQRLLYLPGLGLHLPPNGEVLLDLGIQWGTTKHRFITGSSSSAKGACPDA